MSCPELSKAKSKEVPKSILKKKSQFDQNSSGDAESYPRVKPVKSIRFSLDGSKRTNSLRMPTNMSTDLKGDKKKECQNKKEKKKRPRKADDEKKTEESVRQETEEKKPLRDNNIKERNETSGKLVRRCEKGDVKPEKKIENENTRPSLHVDKVKESQQEGRNGRSRSSSKEPLQEDTLLSPRPEEGTTGQDPQEEILLESGKNKKKKRQRKGRKRRRRRKDKGRE